MIGARVVLRPRSLFETADLTSALMRTHVRLFLRLLPWVLVPEVLAWVVHALTGIGPDVAMLGGIAVSSITSGVYTVLCGDLMLRADVDLKDVQKRFLRALPAFFVHRLASWLVLGVSGGLALSWTAFVPEASLLEQGTVASVLTRSRALLRATPGRSLAWAFALLVVLNVGVLGAEVGYHELRSLIGLGGDPRNVFSEHLSYAPFIGAALATPYLAALRFLLYIDCRTRREGWDLQVQMNALVKVAEVAPGRHASEEAA